MCDTMCSLPVWSKSGSSLFAKNSDRPPGEAHHVLWQSPDQHTGRSYVKCTYIEIPQASHTHGVMMYKPSWCWGCEMGVNDNGVAVGNEAVFTTAQRSASSLIGMDFVRLALEKAGDAQQAVDVIVQLLEQHGQGGQCGYDVEMFYDNSYLIADPHSGYVLETAGSKWAVRAFREYEAISNELCIRYDHTMRGGIGEEDDFAGDLADPVLSRAVGARKRRRASLRALASPPTVRSMMQTLRLHNLEKDSNKESKYSLCMHTEKTDSNTAGSLIAVLRKDNYCTLWTTGSSLPCLSMFKPVFLGDSPAKQLFVNSAQSNDYWVKWEEMHGKLAQYQDYIIQRDALEQEWLEAEAGLISGKADAITLAAFTEMAMEQEKELIGKYITCT